jgi:hypothetical protein
MKFSHRRFLIACAACGVLLACGDDDDEREGPCTPGTAEGCDDDQVCEQVAGGEPACFAAWSTSFA